MLDLSSDFLARQARQTTPVDLFSGYCSRLPPRVKRSALVLFESTASAPVDSIFAEGS
jgi:hypothetical protein